MRRSKKVLGSVCPFYSHLPYKILGRPCRKDLLPCINLNLYVLRNYLLSYCNLPFFIFSLLIRPRGSKLENIFFLLKSNKPLRSQYRPPRCNFIFLPHHPQVERPLRKLLNCSPANPRFEWLLSKFPVLSIIVNYHPPRMFHLLVKSHSPPNFIQNPHSFEFPLRWMSMLGEHPSRYPDCPLLNVELRLSWRSPHPPCYPKLIFGCLCNLKRHFMLCGHFNFKFRFRWLIFPYSHRPSGHP